MLEDVLCRKIYRLWIIRASNALSSLGKIVRRMLQLNVGSEQEPIGSWFPKRHSYAASIYNSGRPNHAVKLHVRMAADDQWRIKSIKDLQEGLFRRQASEVFILVSGRRVAKQHHAQPVN